MQKSEQRKIYVESIRERLSAQRFAHCLGVEKAALALAQQYGESEERASTAALLHDYAKELPKSHLLDLAKQYRIEIDDVYADSPGLLHGPVAACLVKEKFHITDELILKAIRNHTVGAASMSTLEKIIYLADMIEETRDFCGINIIREAARNSLDEGMYMALTRTIAYTMERRLMVHPDSIEAYNDLLRQQKENGHEAV